MSTSRFLTILLCGVALLGLGRQTSALSCSLQSVCSVLGYSSQTAIVNSGPSLKTYLSCPWRASASAVTQVKWLFSPDTGTPQVLNIDEDAKLTTERYTLVISNISSEYEGIYSCKFQYSDGSESIQMKAGCVFVEGRSHFTSCPSEQTSEGCSDTTHLEGEEHGSVEFDARLDYSHGGTCGLRQKVRHMYLNRIDDNGNSETIFICSNLGSFGSRKCENRTHVTIFYQGEDKYDLKISLNSLSTSNSGRYQLVVNRNEMEGRRTAIYKEFSVTVRAKSTSPLPTAVSTQPPNLSEDVAPLLMLDGEVVANGSNVTLKSIKVKGQALLCVVPHKHCCDTEGSVTAEFLYPDGTLMTADEGWTQGLYVTRGRQMIRLNYAPGMVDVLPPAGSYCCTVSTGITNSVCVNLLP